MPRHTTPTGHEIEWHEGPGGKHDPRQIGLIRAGDIIIDQRVQRPVTRNGIDTKKGDNWNWNLAEALTVTIRDDGTIVADEGQHRTLALQETDPDALIWCIRTTGPATIAGEAGTALGIARSRRGHRRLDEWRLLSYSGDPHVADAEHVLHVRNMVIGEGGSGRVIAAAGTVLRIIRGTAGLSLTPAEGAALLDATLGVLAVIPSDDPLSPRRHDSMLLLAVSDLLRAYPDIDKRRLETKLSARTVDQWLAFRPQTGLRWRGIQTVMISDYNRGLRGSRIGDA